MKTVRHIIFISALLRLSGLFAQQGEWELISHYPTEKTIYDVAFLDEQRGFLVTEEGLFLSSDGGATWNISAILTQPIQEIDAKDETIALIGVDGNSSFSTNGGQFWNTVELPFCLSSVDVLGQDTIVFLGKDEMLTTVNGGIDWQTDPGPFVNAFYCPDYSQVISLDLSYAIHEETLYKKSGSSALWEEVETLAIQEFVSFAFKNDSIGVVSLDTGNLRITEDGGETWAEITPNLTQSYEYAEYHPSGKYLFANESGHVAWSVNDGQSWNYFWLIEGYFSNDDIEGIGFSGEEMWIMGKHGSMYTNTTGAIDGWEKQFATRNIISRISPTEDGHLFFQAETSFLRYENSIAHFSESILEGFSPSNIDDLEMVTENKGFFITNQEELMITEDGCESWQEYDVGPYTWQNFVEIEFLNESIGYNSQDRFNSVYKTEDGGETWSLSLNNNVTGRIRIVDESVVFLVNDNSELHTFYRSYDGGESWQQRGDVNTEDLRDFWFVDESIGYAIGISEMFKTEDGGLSWQLWTGPEDALGLRQILFITEQVGFLWNSATGASLYSTNDGGETWIDEQLSNIKVLERDDEYVYAAGNRGRIYRRPISAILNTSFEGITDAVKIYPNPAQNYVDIESGRLDWQRIEIYNVTGSLVHESTLESSIVHRLALDKFNSGIYLVSLIGKNDVSSSKLIISREE